MLWPFCFLSALLVFLAGLIWSLRGKKGRGDRFLPGVISAFVAGWILYFPYEYFIDVPQTPGALRFFECLLTALLRTFNVYSGNGYERISEALPGAYGSWYSILFLLISIAFMIYVMGIAMSFFCGPVQEIRYFFERRKPAAIFSVCSERTLSIAAGIRAKEKLIVFSVPETPERETIRRIAEAGGIFLSRSLPELLSDREKQKSGTEFFLFGDSEEENLNALSEIAGRTQSSPGKIRIYCEVQQLPFGVLDGILGAKDGAPVVNLVHTEENFAYHDLLRSSIFEDAAPIPGREEKEIRVLLAGSSERTFEMLKTILFLSQMPGYRLNALVLTGEAQRPAWQQRMPEVKDECHTDGDAEYRIRFRTGLSFASLQVEDAVEEALPGFTFAFVDTEDDMQTLSLALRLKAVRLRSGFGGRFRIEASVRSPELCSGWAPERMEQIACVGSREEVYSYSFVTMTDLERAAKKIHEVRQQEKLAADPQAAQQSWDAYCGNDYNRRSVYARTLCLKHRLAVIDRQYGGDYSLIGSDPLWRKYEHMRWNMYTRVMGYRAPGEEMRPASGKIPKALRNAAMVHPDLVPFDQLPQEEQAKDSVRLTEEIIRILKEL